MSVTAAKGFAAGSAAAGLKTTGELDLTIVQNLGPDHTAAAVFTANRVVAAPVTWSRTVLANQSVAAVVLNSGGANACTGARGLADTKATATAVGDALEVASDRVAVCSTGLIGEHLPMDNVLSGVAQASVTLTDGAAAAGAEAGDAAARAIMTTDTVPKVATETINTGRGTITVGGMAKGAGMLAPELATMLCVITTDAHLDKATADRALRAATATTFDRVDVDGCMSTNDTVLLMASGASGSTPDEAAFTRALTRVCDSLAAQLVDDAEGASHTINVTVGGATGEDAALAVGRAVTRSALVKTAIFGNDPNWGRILSAIGTVPEHIAPFDPDGIDVAINEVTICRGGAAGEDRSLVDLSGREVNIDIDLGAGPTTATVRTTDLTHDYVHENSAYSS